MISKRGLLLLPVAALLFLVPGRPVAKAEPAALEERFAKDVKPFLNQHCVRCHNADKLTSGIRVDHLNASMEFKHLKLWQEVRSQVRDRAMPPEDAKQPTEAERSRLVAWIDQALVAAKARPTPKNGLVRRLTVAQYRNTLRELLRLEDDFTEILPPDAVSRDGFLNNSETLQLSPLLLEAYIEIAENALEQCFVDPQSKPRIQNFRMDLGTGINRDPCKDDLILGANSLLLNNRDFVVTQPPLTKPFASDPVAMRTKYRFIEGYAGNATVRGWREYDSLYHAVFACMRGSRGYPKGEAYSVVPEGLLLRPSIPNDETFRGDGTYGPKANFKISLRELPDHGRFRMTVTAAKYDDGLLLTPGTPTQPANAAGQIVAKLPVAAGGVKIPNTGLFQIDVHSQSPAVVPKSSPTPKAKGKGSQNSQRSLTLTLGNRQFHGTLSSHGFLLVRLPAGDLRVEAQSGGQATIDRVVMTPISEEHPLAKQFLTFEKRSPRLGVHLGLRRDCGSTLSPVGQPQTVAGTTLQRFVFEGAMHNFPSPEVEKDNVNYLAGVREIGVRSEYTDGRDMPRLLIRSVEFEGPFYENWPPVPHRNIFKDRDPQQKPAAYARTILRDFATRAFRRPVTAAEEAALFEVYDQATQNGASFQNAIRDSILFVLTSPQFLFLIERSTTPKAEPLDEFELASKLSYFLWNGPPDEALLAKAASGSLSKTLDSEVARMVADRRFERFSREFVSQWLALEKFQVLEPDRARFPRLSRDVRGQLAQEPVRFVEHLIRENLPVKNLIQSDFILANETVASYYDLADMTESGFNFIPVHHGRQDLGGVVTQAAILAGLSDGRESNPVKRGAWLARRIVAEPPDDPPPNVPALKDENTKLSLRERLEQHRNQAGCAQCHSKIDPWGIPFEEYDAGGRVKLAVVDASSTLPDKTRVRGVQDLKRHLAGDRLDQVAFSVLKHLAIYATGRNLTYNELEYLRREGVKLKPSGYRMQDMVRFVTSSPIFLEK